MSPSPTSPRRSLFLIAAASACIFTQAASAQTVILVDLNENAGSGGPGGTWNTYAVPTAINGGTVVNAQNLATPITLSISGIVADNTANGGLVVFNPNQARFEGLPTWVTSTTNNSASGDNFFTNNTTTTVSSYTITFGNLAPGDVVEFDLLASRDSANARGFFEYSLDGSNWLGFTVLNADGTLAATNGWDTLTTAQGAGGQAFSLQTQGFQQHRYMNVSDVTLTGSTFSVRTTDADATTGNFSAMNAMRLSIVPEPASAALAIGGGLAVLGMARRRRG